MKKALFFLIAVTLFTACKNEKRPSTNRVKDDYRSNDKNTDNSNNDRNTDSRNKEDNTASWPRSDENKFMDECESSAKENVGAVRANEYCDCMLQKMKKMYSSLSETNRKLDGKSQEEINELASDCNTQ